MTSRDIEVTFGGRSREHVSRLMKKLFDDGFVERNKTKRPYTYSITDSGRKRIGSEENIVYAVSQ
jgi:predicted transcriptional regulator